MIVADGLIEAVVPVGTVETRDGDQTIDLAQATLIPGLINNHVHLVLSGDNSPFEPVQLGRTLFLSCGRLTTRKPRSGRA